MTAKKRWCVRTWDDFSCRSGKDPDISWSSSEDESCQPKKIKLLTSQPDNFCDEDDSLVNCSAFASHVTREDCCESPIIGSSRLGETSPVLKSPVGALGLDKTSPVLNYNSRKSVINNLKESPVLVRRCIVKANDEILTSQNNKTKKLLPKIENFEISYSFLHNSDEDSMIDISESPESALVPTQWNEIIESNSSSRQSNVIISQYSNYSLDPFLTPLIQNSPSSPHSNSNFIGLPEEDVSKSPLSNIKISESTQSLSSKTSGFEVLHQEAKMKKKYQKGGLADQLEKALHKQRADFAIWRHELYLKINNSREEEFLLLKIRDLRNEFGATVVECEVLEKEDNEYCIVVLGYNVTHALCLKINARLKLYEPYMMKLVKYKEGVICCYFNVLKIISCK